MRTSASSGLLARLARGALGLLVALAALAAVAPLPAAAQCINTVFGSAGGSTAPSFQYVDGVATLRGRIYFSDKNGMYVIYRDSTYDKLVGGGSTKAVPDEGLPPLELAVVYIMGMAADARRNRIYFTDSDSSRVLYLDLNTNLLFRVAGAADGLRYGNTGDGGLSTAALLGTPRFLSLWVERDELLIPDSYYHVVRSVNLTTGIIRTIAGGRVTPTLGGASRDGGSALDANLYAPYAAVPDPVTGTIYVSEAKSGTVRAISASGNITTVLGVRGTVTTYTGDGGPAKAATTKYPTGLAVDPVGRRLYMADYKAYAIRVIDLNTGNVTRVAGEPPDQFGRTGDRGPALLSRLNTPYQLLWDAPTSTLLIAEEGSSVVRAIFANATIDTITVSAKAVGAGAAVAVATPTPAPLPAVLAAPLRTAAADTVPENPMEATVDCTDGTMYMTEPDGNVVRKITREAEASVFVGTFRLRTTTPAPDGSVASNTSVGRPGGLALDNVRRLLFFIDLLQNRVYMVDMRTGLLSTLTGTGATENSADGVPAKGAAIYKARYMAADTVGGRLFISCDLTHVVRMVNYGGDGTITTIAGSDGIADYAGDGGPAAAALLSSPFRAGWDSLDEAYIFWDSGNDVIRRIAAPVGRPIGNITTIAGDPSASVTTVPEGGIDAMAIQTAGGDGFAVDSTRRYVYYADSQFVSRLDLRTSRISVVAGARTLATGGAGAGGHPLNFTITTARFVTPDCLGGFFFKNVFTVMHVTGIDGPPASTPCPPGYACPCGRRPVPCAEPGTYCPRDTGAVPRNVSNGFMAVPVPESLIIGSAGGYYSQKPCAAGTLCYKGQQTQCPVGTYGLDDMQMTVAAACLQCPAGTYQPLVGLGLPAQSAAAASPCRSCPPGTYSKAAGSKACHLCRPNTYGAVGSGAANASVGCAACPANSWATVGATKCLPLLENDKVSADATSANFLRLATFDPENEPFLLAALSIGIPLLIIFSMPLLSVVCTRFGPAGMRQKFGACLTKVDNTGLAHPVPVGASPVKKPTSLGGGFTVFFIGVFLAVSSVQISQYINSNTVVQQGLLPVSFGDLAGMTAIPPFAKVYPDLQSVAPDVRSGFAIVLDTMGPDCAAFDGFAIDLLAGSMEGVSYPDPSSDAVRHVFRCPNCVLSALSEFGAWFPPTCTSFAVTLVAIGGWGKVSYSSNFVQDAQSVAVQFLMGLELVQDSIEGSRVKGGVVYTGGRSARGWSLSPGIVNARTDLGLSGDDSEAPTVYITLPLDTTYTQALLKPSSTAVQLTSSIVGLLSLLGIAKILIMLVARARAVRQEREARRKGAVAASLAAPPSPSPSPAPAPATINPAKGFTVAPRLALGGDNRFAAGPLQTNRGVLAAGPTLQSPQQQQLAAAAQTLRLRAATAAQTSPSQVRLQGPGASPRRMPAANNAGNSTRALGQPPAQLPTWPSVGPGGGGDFGGGFGGAWAALARL